MASLLQLEVLQAWFPWNFKNSWPIWGVGISVYLEDDTLVLILNVFILFQQTGWRLSVHGLRRHHGQGKQEMDHFSLLQKLVWMSCYVFTSSVAAPNFLWHVGCSPKKGRAGPFGGRDWEKGCATHFCILYVLWNGSWLEQYQTQATKSMCEVFKLTTVLYCVLPILQESPQSACLRLGTNRSGPMELRRCQILSLLQLRKDSRLTPCLIPPPLPGWEFSSRQLWEGSSYICVAAHSFFPLFFNPWDFRAVTLMKEKKAMGKRKKKCRLRLVTSLFSTSQIGFGHFNLQVVKSPFLIRWPACSQLAKKVKTLQMWNLILHFNNRKMTA